MERYNLTKDKRSPLRNRLIHVKRSSYQSPNALLINGDFAKLNVIQQKYFIDSLEAGTNFLYYGSPFKLRFTQLLAVVRGAFQTFQGRQLCTPQSVLN